MAKKKSLEELKALNDKLSASVDEAKSTLKSKQDRLEALNKKITDMENKARSRSMIECGAVAKKFFGKDVSPEELSELLSFVFTIDEVQAFVNDEKEKRFLRDNPAVVMDSSANEKIAAANVYDNSELQKEENIPPDTFVESA